MNPHNDYTEMQTAQYAGGTSNHLEHNENPDYWKYLLSQKCPKKQKYALDFGCGKGRNVQNMISTSTWERVDGADISKANIEHCKIEFPDSKFYQNNGVDLREIPDNTYDFVMSTITLQHIPVYDIRHSLITEISRVMRTGAVFSFQMGCGRKIESHQAEYKDNNYGAKGTNSKVDVNIGNANDLVNHLEMVGFNDITFNIKPAFSDTQHKDWIYTRAIK